ncbi:hypothetical protein BDC45DRAFT_242526 [Circinella umbellata]|nr:hypothetical protein BDC45DRAFT_242526 [Circinella umbellata]
MIAVVENRSQDEYRLAGLHNKYVANKQWLINTRYREEFHAPTMTIMDYPLPIGAVPGSHNKTFSIEGFLGMERQSVKYAGHAIGFVFCPFICPEVNYAIFKR